MSGDEFRTRIGQEFAKRAEYARYRAGWTSKPHLATRERDRAPRFFFTPQDVSGRVGLLRNYLPKSVSATIEEADEILEHRFRLLGYRDLDYGKEIDWHLDAVHGKRAPLKPWYKIHFLDFNEVGDHKVTWELNRHQHLVTLGKAWAFTGETKYPEEIERQFYFWHKANPYPVGINWGSSLEVAFRSLSWIWVRELLGTNLAENFDRDLVRGLARNGSYIERYLSTYFSPNTHLLGEALALFFIGTLCPEIPSAQGWQIKGLKILSAEIQRQVRPDGVYFEQSLYYHVYALDMFLHARALAVMNGMPFPDSYDSVLRKMLDVLNALCRNGPPQGFGDDDGGRLFNPRRDRAEHMADPLALGACLFNDGNVSAASLSEESIWLFGEKAPSFCDRTGKTSALHSCAFANGGLYVIASEERPRAQMLLDAGPHGTGHGGHGHADALSARLSIAGVPWLIDPGAYIYVSPGDERNRFRGTSAHNTVRIDGLDQAVPETPFSWSSLPEVTAEQWEQGEQFTFFTGSHTGYQRLEDPVLHRRSVFHLHGEYWLVRDTLSGRAEHDVEIFWHFAPGAELRTDAASLSAKQDGQNLSILGSDNVAWEISIETGSVSPAYGRKETAPVGIFRSRQKLPADHGSLIVPVSASARPGTFRPLELAASGATGFSYQRGEVQDQFYFGADGQEWSANSVSSDADFVFLRRERQEIVALISCGASFVDVAGQRVFSASAKVGHLEWSLDGGARSSDPQSLKCFRGELIRPGTPVR